MKKMIPLSLLILTVVFSSCSSSLKNVPRTPASASGEVIIYTNDQGCIIEKETRAKGVIYYTRQADQWATIGHTNDFASGDFAYCAPSQLQLNHFSGAKGTGLMMSCSEHQNDHAVTRGRVDLSIMNGELSELAIDGQVKSFFGWKQDTLIKCTNLIRQN